MGVWGFWKGTETPSFLFQHWLRMGERLVIFTGSGCRADALLHQESQKPRCGARRGATQAITTTHQAQLSPYPRLTSLLLHADSCSPSVSPAWVVNRRRRRTVTSISTPSRPGNTQDVVVEKNLILAPHSAQPTTASTKAAIQDWYHLSSHTDCAQNLRSDVMAPRRWVSCRQLT